MAGYLVRQKDKYGSGGYLAPRDGGSRKHSGVDLAFWPGTPLIAPCYGKVVRVARPYADDNVLSGLVFQPLEQASRLPVPGAISFKILYAQPDRTHMGHTVLPGVEIAVVQDVGARYPGITPHIHFEVYQDGMRVDPMPYLTGESR